MLLRPCRCSLRCFAAQLKAAFWPLMVFAFLWVLSSSVLNPAKAQQQPPARAELVLGMMAYQPKPVLAFKWAPLVRYLNQHSPNNPPIRLRLLTQPEMDEALKSNELDFVFTNPVHYINMRTQGQLSGALATLVTSNNGYATSQLGGVVIRRSDTPGIRTLSDLNGKEVGILGRRYLGGYAAQAAALLDQGVSLDSINFRDVGDNHFDIVNAVVRGQVQAGFVRTGTLETMYELGLLTPGEISVVAPLQYPDFPFAVSTGLYPEWAFVALADTPVEYSQKVAALLYNLSPHHPAAWQAGVAGFTIPADYAPVEAVMRQLRMSPFDGSPPFGWRDIWQKYKLMLIFSGALILGIFMLATVLVHSYRRERNAQRTSKDTLRRLESIIEGTEAGTWEWNVQTGELRLNTRWAQIVGYQLFELEPVSIHTWLRLVHPDDLKLSETLLERHFADEREQYNFEARMRHKKGHWVWVHDRGRLATRTPDGKPEWMFGTHVDISARRNVQAERDAWLTRFRELSANVPGGLYQYCLDSSGNSSFLFVSDGMRDIYGLSAEELLNDGASVLRRMHSDDVAGVKASFELSARTLTTWHHVYRVLHPSQGERWVEVTATPKRHDDGSILWHGYIIDITELKSARDQVRLAASVYQASREGICITDQSHCFIDVNRAFVELTGYELDDVQGAPNEYLFVQSPDTLKLPAAFFAALEQEGCWQGELWARRDAQGFFPIELSVVAVYDEKNAVSHYVTVFSDVSERKQYEKELNEMAHFDPLTGIPNRRLFGERLKNVLAKARINSERVAVCMMDLDHFKPVNDQFGHEAGDKVLVEVARRLESVIRKDDTVARLGGDEYAMIVCNPQDESIFERILAAVRAPIVLAQGQVYVSGSLGVAYFDPERPLDGDLLLRQADQAAYTSKSAGRDRVTVYESEDVVQ